MVPMDIYIDLNEEIFTLYLIHFLLHLSAYHVSFVISFYYRDTLIKFLVLFSHLKYLILGMEQVCLVYFVWWQI